MAFFGLTTLGPSEPISDGIAQSQLYEFHEISDLHYQEVFNKYLIGDSQIALTLQIDGNDTILRAGLGDMLRELLGRQPRKHELDAWYTYLDFDRSAIMSRSEFTDSVSKLIDFSSNPQIPKQYTSYDRKKADWLRCARVEYEPQQALKAPMTTQQEIGWHVKKPAPHEKSHPLNQTDVTLREGRNAASYYGHFVVNN